MFHNIDMIRNTKQTNDYVSNKFNLVLVTTLLLLPKPERQSIRALKGWTNKNRQIKSIYKWKHGPKAEQVSWDMQDDVFKARLEGFAIARRIDITTLEGQGQSLMQNNENVALQHLHRDYMTTSYPSHEQCADMMAAEKKRKADQQLALKEEDEEEVEVLFVSD